MSSTLVTGIPRSGTSLVTHLLAESGLSLGETVKRTDTGDLYDDIQLRAWLLSALMGRRIDPEIESQYLPYGVSLSCGEIDRLKVLGEGNYVRKHCWARRMLRPICEAWDGPVVIVTRNLGSLDAAIRGSFLYGLHWWRCLIERGRLGYFLSVSASLLLEDFDAMKEAGLDIKLVNTSDALDLEKGTESLCSALGIDPRIGERVFKRQRRLK